jgi:hypothetical protein
MRRLLPIALFLAACAPSAGSTLSPAPQAPARVEETGSGYDIRLSHDNAPVGATFAVPVDRLWPIALQAYTSLGLRADATDAAGHQVQTRSMVVRRRLAGEPLSAYFDCGTELAGSIADFWRLRIDAAMAVTPVTADSARVATMVRVTATPVEGTSTTVTECSSRGRLEGKLASAIRAALAK